MINPLPKILYLEDEHFLGRIVRESLESRGYNIRLVSHGSQFIKEFDQFGPDICVMDIMVPGVDGLELCQQLREKDHHIPVIFLSAKVQTPDVIKGFKSGGNDYLKKPFSMEELIVRIDNLLHLSQQTIQSDIERVIQIASYLFDYAQLELKNGKKLVKLSHRENEIIRMLAMHLNQKVDRKKILQQIWGDDNLYNSRNLDVYIRKIRIYFADDPAVQLNTLRGVGYKLCVPTVD